MRIALLILLLFIGIANGAPPSQQPSLSSPAKGDEKPHHKPSPKDEPTPGDKSVHPTPSVSVSVVAGNSSNTRADKSEEKSAAEWWAAIGSVISAIVAVILARIAWLQFRMFGDQLGKMKEANEIAASAAGAAKASAEASALQLKNLMNTERALVKISHTSPGIRWQEGSSLFMIEFETKNVGRGTAEVTDERFNHVVWNVEDDLPNFPDYGDEQQRELMSNVFGPGDPVYFSRWFTLSDTNRDKIEEGRARLFIFGYVDYIDAFKRRHRGGYARLYEPLAEGGPNLTIVVRPNYNYDRERKPGEGIDWDDAAKEAYEAANRASS